MQYRLSFVLDALTTAVSSLLAFLTFYLVIHRFENIAGWRAEEVAFLFGLVEISFGLMDLVFSGFDPDYFSIYVRRGLLDQMLLRPAGITLQVLGSRFVLRRLGRIASGLAILFYAISVNPIQWDIARVFYLPVVIASMAAYFGGLFMLGSTLTLWTVERNQAMNILTYGGSEMMAYPMDIYPGWMRRFFTWILPAIFLNYYPALYFLGKPDPLHMPGFSPFLAPLAGSMVLLAAALAWKIGLRHYQSTGT